VLIKKVKWDDVKSGIKSGARIAEDKLKRITRIGVLHAQEMGIKRKIGSCHASIGKCIFNLAAQDGSVNGEGDPAVQKAIEETRRLKEKLKKLEQKNGGENEGRPEKTGTAAEMKKIWWAYLVAFNLPPNNTEKGTAYSRVSVIEKERCVHSARMHILGFRPW
jgi:hypothetical protein